MSNGPKMFAMNKIDSRFREGILSPALFAVGCPEIAKNEMVN
jgi:hypothetical protein